MGAGAEGRQHSRAVRRVIAYRPRFRACFARRQTISDQMQTIGVRQHRQPRLLQINAATWTKRHLSSGLRRATKA
jgi:hypothetical protein